MQNPPSSCASVMSDVHATRFIHSLFIWEILVVVRKLRRHLGKGYKHVHIIYFYNRMDETDKHRNHGLHIGVLRIIISS